MRLSRLSRSPARGSVAPSEWGWLWFGASRGCAFNYTKKVPRRVPACSATTWTRGGARGKCKNSMAWSIHANMGLFDHFFMHPWPLLGPRRDQAPIHAPPAGHGGTPNAGRTPSNTPAIPAAVPAHGPADLTHPTLTPGALWPESRPSPRAIAPSLSRRRRRQAVAAEPP